MCCCCCKSGPLSCEISIPKYGFVPGESINIDTYVENMSNVSAENVKFELRRTIEFTTYSPQTKHKYDSDALQFITEGGIGAHGDKRWIASLPIPTDHQYPNLEHCNIIKVSYSVKVRNVYYGVVIYL